MKDAAKSQMVHDNDELDTHGVPFQKLSVFHRLAGDLDHEVQSSVYHDLMNLMLSQTTENNQLINVSGSRTKADSPFHSNLEKNLHLRRSRTIYTYGGLSRRHNGLSTVLWGCTNLASSPKPTFLLISGLPLP